ncbi:arginine--tRNA ligase [Candidatus Woesearchaeota archaeon]|nr:arginine--tRNA ligase [Candidatus Woesearchaeota archaeon]
MFRKDVVRLVAENAGISALEADKLLEIPPNPELGDYAFPCFGLAKSLKKAPVVIAAELAEKIKVGGVVSSVKAVGPYINFFVDKNKMAEHVLADILKCSVCYGSGPMKDEKVMIEYPAPNTNKPLHLGHVRNMLLGNAVCNLLGFGGYTAIPVNLVNDRGVHICKSMLAYQKWGDGKEPSKKSDHYVGDFYVMYSKYEKEHPEIEDEVREMLMKWEQGDKELVALWHKMRKWALDGFSETYKLFDVHHKKEYYESEIYLQGKDLILGGVEKGLFYKDEEGAVVVDLSEAGLGKKVLLREDGTSIYITQDIFLAKQKFDDFQMDRSVYVVGSEQNHHFKVLFKIIEMLGFPYASKCYHLSYGMVNLPEGRMKSREGTVVDADDLYAEMKEEAVKEIMKRHPDIEEKELEARSKIIAMGALKFFILKYDPQKDMIYNPAESISFEGETGPYVQYAHARICSILRQVADFRAEGVKGHYEHPKEERLITLMAGFPAVVAEAAEAYRPSNVARFGLELAQAFNEFYQECPVLKAEKKVKESRLLLITCVRTVLRNTLDLLGIVAPEEM